MRILKVSYAYPPFLRGGGPPMLVKATAEELARRGHEVTVVTSNFDCRRETRAARLGGVEVVYLASLARYRETVTLNPGLLHFCHQRLRTFDAVHVYGMYDLLGPVAGFLARRWRIPYLLQPMGMFRPITRGLLRKRAYHALLGHPLARGSAALVAASEREARQLVQEGVPASKVTIARHGIDVAEYDRLPPPKRFHARWGIPDDATVILYLGRLTRTKRPDLLLDAFAAVPGTTSRLVFAGPDEDGQRRALGEQARRLGILSRIVFTGLLEGEEKKEAFAAADVFALPSSSENFGIAVVEAMASGTAVLVTDRCGIAPLVEGGAGLVVPLEASAIRDALRRLVTDEPFRTACSRRGRLVAQELTWDEPVSQVEEIYRRVLAAGPKATAGSA